MMKTLTQIAVECGAHVQPCKTTYPRHDEIAFDNERELQAFVDAVNKQNESHFEMIEKRLNQIAQNPNLKIHVPRTHGKSSLALFDAGWRARDVEIESLRQQLAERDELVKCAIELRKWVADGEFSDDSGIFPSCATKEYKEAVQKFDDAVNTQNSSPVWQGLDAKEIASIPLNEYTVQTVEKMLKEKNT
jgi:hypothetical protein